MNTYQYQVIVTGTCPTPVTSTAVVLTVNAVPVITTQPTAQTVCAGADATFTVVATGASLIYQWQENTGSGFVNIAGATSASYTKMATTAVMNGYQYQVIVSGTCTPGATSTAALLTVNTAPAITIQPTAATVCAGVDATFTVTATGTGLTYQWQENTGSGFVNITGAMSASYTKTATTAAMNTYQYQVIVSGTCTPPATSTPVVLTVNSAPAITTQPTAATVCAGANATFTVVATGTSLTYQWQENTGSGFVNIAGATTASYTKMATTAVMNGYQYQVVISGPCTPLTSTAALLTVDTAPAITTQPVNTTVCAGIDANFAVVATGSGLTYQWQENTGSGFVNIAGATSSSYTKSPTTSAISGYTYRVVVTGTCTPAVTSSTVTLTVNALPAITAQPANATLCAGNNAIFNVTATGSGLTYQWQENTGSGFVNVLGATASLFVKSSVTVAMSGYQYRVILSGACPPAVTSSTVLLTVNALPAITTQPASATTCAGANVTFTTTATGSGLTYQWQEDTGSGFVDITGATTTSYTKTGITAAMNGYQYQVIVSGTCTPPVTSSVATLTVTTAPAITVQPVAVTTCAGANAVFSVTTTGAGVGYRWQVDDGSGFVDIPGATAATYTKVAAPASFNGYLYRVIVGGVCPPSVTSSTALLTIQAGPSITTQPASLATCVASNATFTVVASGPGLSYQWQENTGSGFVDIAGATSASYTKTGITALMTGYSYRVLVTGICAPTVTSTAAVMTVDAPPTFTTQPANAAVCEGVSATFTSVATGVGVTYQWQENTGSGFVNIAGATSASYTKTGTTAAMSGYTYRVIATGACSPPATSSVVTLTVNAAPAITTQPAAVTVCAGANATFTVVATGAGLTYQWQENTGSGFVNIAGATSASYTKMATTAAMNTYQYQVIISGTCTPPVTSSAVVLTVNTPPVIVTNPNAITACVGTGALFSVMTTGTGLTYQWQENTGSGFVDISGATSALYTKPAVTVAMTGYLYQVIVTGTCPSSVTSTTAALTVDPAPAITVQPAATTVCPGTNATFTVTATGPGLTYQWQEDAGAGFVNIAGATSTSYTKTAPTLAMNGYDYRVIVSGTCAPPATSSGANLAINTPATPAIVETDNSCIVNDGTIAVGGSATLTASGGVSYVWDDASTLAARTVSPVATTTYVVTATDANGCTATASATVVVAPNCGGVELAMKVFLGGAYDDGTDMMKDGLRTTGLIPNAQPYGGADYTDFAYSGTETIGAGVLTTVGANAIVDWVLVELRSSANPATVVARKVGSIQRDGDIVSSTDGTSALFFNGVTPGNYYISVRHRNHLGVMSATALTMSNTPLSLDFTNASTAMYQLPGGNGSIHAQRLLTNGKRALWDGNMSNSAGTGNQLQYQGGNSDSDETYFKVLLDLGNLTNVPNYIVNGYERADGNLDGKVIFQGGEADADIPFFNVLIFPDNTLNVPTFIIYQQVP